MDKDLRHKIETILDPDRALKCQYCAERSTCTVYTQVPEAIRKKLLKLKKENKTWYKVTLKPESQPISAQHLTNSYFSYKVIGECYRHRLAGIYRLISTKKGVRID